MPDTATPTVPATETAAPDTTASDAAGSRLASLSRRSVLAGACVTCATALTACATYGPGSASPAPAQAQAPAPASGAPTVGGGAAESKGGPALTQVAKVPVGGGVIVGDTVVTQPKKGEFKAFGVICPHAGCTVNEVADGTINCPCHGSKFSVADGSVTDGPAPKGLDVKKVSVSGTDIKLA
jgi:Rieske Fe-S protein